MYSPRVSLRSLSVRSGYFDDLEQEDDESKPLELLKGRMLSPPRMSNGKQGDVEIATSPSSSDTGTDKAADDETTPEETEKEIVLASVLFLLVGIGYLFPFSALTQPVDYWNLLFPDYEIEFDITAYYMYTNLISLALLVFLADGDTHISAKIVLGFIGQLCILVFVPTSYFFMYPSDGEGETTKDYAGTEDMNRYVVLGASAMAAIVTAFLDSAVISLATQYPLRVQEYFQLGVGVSTLIGSLYRDFTKIAFPPSMLVESSLIYFYTGAITIALCIGAYYKLTTLKISQKAFERVAAEASASVSEATATDAVGETKPLLLEQQQNKEEEKEPKEEKTKTMVVDKFDVLKRAFFNECMVSLEFMSTLALWPPLVTEIPSYNNFAWLIGDGDPAGWWGLILLTVFSVTDCGGRVLVQKTRLGITKDNIWMSVIGRIVFLFPLVICSVKGYIFVHDLFSMVFVGLLGFTNGYLGTLSIIVVNDVFPDNEQEQAVAGTFTSFFLNTGLVLGASLGLIFEKVV